MEYQDDDPSKEVLYSRKVSSSDFVRWQKQDVQTYVGADAKCLLLVVYWDKTSKDIRGKFMMHAVYVGVSQIDPDTNTKWMCKRHIGFLPIPILSTFALAPGVSATQQTETIKTFGRELYQLSLRYMLEPLAYFQHAGLDFTTHEGEIMRLVPRLFHFTGDIPEG